MTRDMWDVETSHNSHSATLAASFAAASRPSVKSARCDMTGDPSRKSSRLGSPAFFTLTALMHAFALPVGSSAAVVYTENFDADHTANWVFQSYSGDARNDNVGQECDFFFDYS